MDHINIIKRAFTITWSYRVLWVFGFLLALTLPRNNGSSNSGVQFSGNDFQGGGPFPNFPVIPPQVVSAVVTSDTKRPRRSRDGAACFLPSSRATPSPAASTDEADAPSPPGPRPGRA